jgi:two-component system response regulator AlgR
MSLLHLLIVDDEALARVRLRSLLTQCVDAQGASYELQIDEAANATTALQKLQMQPQPSRPLIDGILLDVQMPGLSGMALAQRLQSQTQTASGAGGGVPAVVFVTAHAEHALQAFEVQAVDYLTKPVRLERLQAAVQKIVEWRARQHLSGPLALQTVDPRPSGVSSFLMVQGRDHIERVPIIEVLYLRAEQKFVALHTLRGLKMLDGSLSDLEQQLGEQVIRIHRNALVARHAVRALEKHLISDPNAKDSLIETWAVCLAVTEEWLPVSRRQVQSVKEALKMSHG